MPYLPGILKWRDARFYQRSLERILGAEGSIQIHDHGKPERVELIDAHFEWPDGVGAWRAARARRLPFVGTLRGKLVSQTADPIRRAAIGEMLRDADGLIAVSRFLAELAMTIAGCDLDIRIIPNGVDAGVFRRMGEPVAARRRLGWDGGRPYVVSVGHLQELKGFHRLAGIWPEVRRRVPDTRLVLVGGEAGEPGYERRLRSEIARLGLDADVIVMGRVEPRTIAEMLNAADVMALWSRSEGWCNALTEALACGCPVVASDVGGNREIVDSMDVGRLVAFEDVEGFASAVVEAIERPWDRAKIAERGGRRDWAAVARECVDVFDGVLRGR